MDTFRKEYKELNQDQKDNMELIKDSAETLLDAMNAYVDPDARSEASRCMAIARTHLETSIMWAVKGVTTCEE